MQSKEIEGERKDTIKGKIKDVIIKITDYILHLVISFLFLISIVLFISFIILTLKFIINDIITIIILNASSSENEVFADSIMLIRIIEKSLNLFVLYIVARSLWGIAISYSEGSIGRSTITHLKSQLFMILAVMVSVVTFEHLLRIVDNLGSEQVGREALIASITMFIYMLAIALFIKLTMKEFREEERKSEEGGSRKSDKEGETILPSPP